MTKATIIHGDCLEELKNLDDNSIDAVICDPPYGLSNTKPQQVADVLKAWVTGDTVSVPAKRGGFMGADWDSFVPPPAVWEECMRVLKPGGHMAVFAGARTQDLMGLSIRLAGFEIRDTLGWITGSGFPKSMDISKAIDKSRNSNRERQYEFTEWMRSTGITAREINEATGTSQESGHLLAGPNHSQPHIATADLFDKLRPLLPEVPERIERLVAERTGIEWSDYVKREVVGAGFRIDRKNGAVPYGSGTENGHYDITAPATSDAAKWSGWGTALKPAIEPVIYAQKPLDNHGIVNLIGSHIYRLEAQCSSTAANAEQSSKHTPAESNGAMESTAHENAATHTGDSRGSETPTGNLGEDSSEGTGTPLSGSMVNTCSNTVMSWRESWEELCKLMSTSTTSTTTEVTTDLRTLLSCISQITVESTPTSPTPALISGSHASVVGNLFAAIVGRLSATLELSAIENATSNIPTSSQGGGGETRTAIEPIILARKSLDGTVAANVLAYGVGGLNIDACRVPSDEVTGWGGSGAGGQTWNSGNMGLGKDGDARPVQGRFPANVLLDEHAAKEMDEQSGVSVSRAGNRGQLAVGQHGGQAGDEINLKPGTDSVRGHTDSGGASRFFPVFKYQAKAPKKERPVIEREDGSKIQHPTVKPLALLEWLVELITPPGGTVLDPFAGSGTTLQAALNKGFIPIGIEQDADYIKLIEKRLEGLCTTHKN